MIFPSAEIGNDVGVIREWAQAADELGFAHLLTYDHVVGAVHEGREPALTGPYTEKTPFHEPFVLFGYLAGITSRIELCTGVIILPQRQTVLVAKQAAELDVLSGGRLRLGVGIGWNYVEYEALNEDFGNRGRRLEEQIEVMRLLWREPVADYAGRWHRIDRAGIEPRPLRQIPIWFGGFADAAIRRAARLGDGFVVTGSRGSQRPIVERLLASLEEAGRDRAEFGIDIMLRIHGDDPDGWREELETWRAAGATHVSLNPLEAGRSPAEHVELVRRYAAVL